MDLGSLGERLTHSCTPHVITGLVPVIPISRGAALVCIGMAGTGPAMTGQGYFLSPTVSPMIHSRVAASAPVGSMKSMTGVS